MAIASIGTLGSAVGSTGATTLALTTVTNALASGDFAIIDVETANLSASDGNHDEHQTISGGTGNWTKLGEYTKSAGVAGSGVTTSCWLFEATATNAIGAVFTVTFSGSVTDKVMRGQKFTKAAGRNLRWAVTAGYQHQEVSAANDFGSSSFASLSSVSRLYFRALGKKANSTTAITPTTNFTVGSPGTVRSRNNAAAVLGASEFRINTSTGETSSPTLAVSGNAESIFVALEEYDPTATVVLTHNSNTNRSGTLLSNGNLTFTGTNPPGVNLAYSTTARAAGYYCEVTVGLAADTLSGIGVDTGAETNFLGAGSATGFGWYSNGSVRNANTIVATYSTFTAGDVLALYVKAGKLYLRKNGTWQNSADPVGGTGGLDISGLGSVLAGIAVDAASDALTANFGASSFSGTIPPGGFSWDGSQSVPALMPFFNRQARLGYMML